MNRKMWVNIKGVTGSADEELLHGFDLQIICFMNCLANEYILCVE